MKFTSREPDRISWLSVSWTKEVPELMRMAEKSLLLQILDQVWKEHLLALDHLRQGIGLRAYAQRDPLNEYKNEAFQLFESMLESLREDVSQKLSQIRPMTEEEQAALMRQIQEQQAAQKKLTEQAQPVGENAPPQQTAEGAAPGFDESKPETWANTGRNELCPCGSGKKFKHCHGRV